MCPRMLKPNEVEKIKNDLEITQSNKITSYPFQSDIESMKSKDVMLLTLDEWKREKVVKKGKKEKPSEMMVSFLKGRLKDGYEFKVIKRTSKRKEVKTIDKDNGGFLKDEQGNYITKMKRVYTDQEVMITKL